MNIIDSTTIMDIVVDQQILAKVKTVLCGEGWVKVANVVVRAIFNPQGVGATNGLRFAT